MKWPITPPCHGGDRRFKSGRARKLRGHGGDNRFASGHERQVQRNKVGLESTAFIIPLPERR